MIRIFLERNPVEEKAVNALKFAAENGDKVTLDDLEVIDYILFNEMEEVEFSAIRGNERMVISSERAKRIREMGYDLR